MNARSTSKPSRVEATGPSRGRADMRRLRRMTEAAIARTSPPEPKGLPDDFREDAEECCRGRSGRFPCAWTKTYWSGFDEADRATRRE